MRISYDEEVDAAYVTLGSPIRDGEAEHQVGFIETLNGVTQVIIDADKDGYLLGFEILFAWEGLRKEVLDAADPL